MEGEYVEFVLVRSTVGAHEYQAMDISGIKGGGLMCETRNASRQTSVERPASSQRSYRVPLEEQRTVQRPDTRNKRRPDNRLRKNPTPSEHASVQA